MVYISESDASMTKQVYLVGSLQYALCTSCVEEAKSDEQIVRHHLTLDQQIRCENCAYREQVGIVTEHDA